MTNDRDLTILLTLKGRHAFTERWMRYAQSIALPYRVLIADGSSDDQASLLLSERARFPDVNYEYLRFKPDLTYADYYAKIVAALARVETPYVALADNDDFLVLDGVRSAVAFLAANPGFVACGGQGALIWVGAPEAAREEERLYAGTVRWKCTREGDRMNGATARERMWNMSVSQSDSFFYDVKKVEVARRHFEIARELNLSDLFLFEWLIWYLMAIEGRTKRLDRLVLARQHDSPGSSGGAHAELHGDWFGRMLVDSWSADVDRFVGTVAARLAEADSLSIEEARRTVIRCYRAAVTPSLLSSLMDEPTANSTMGFIVSMVRRVVRRPQTSLIRRFARALYRGIPWLSLDVVYGTEVLSKPIPEANRDMRRIVDFLARK